MSISVLDRLRAATSKAHRELEGRLNIIERLSAPGGKQTLVPRYYGMHLAAERAAWPWLTSMAGLDIEGRSRLAVIEADLTALHIAKFDNFAKLPSIEGPGEALGLMYVLEGSTLGGKMIRKTLSARGRDLTGLNFLDPYGSRTGTRWRDFIGVLEREAAGDSAAAERGAIAGFHHAEACLLETTAP